MAGGGSCLAIVSFRSHSPRVSYASVPERSEVDDRSLDEVARGEPGKLSTLGRWRAGQDDVAWSQREERREDLDELWDSEQQVGCRRLLDDLTVESTLDVEVVRVGKLVDRDEARSEWAEGVNALPERLQGRVLHGANRRASRAELVDPLRDVLSDGEAG